MDRERNQHGTAVINLMGGGHSASVRDEPATAPAAASGPGMTMAELHRSYDSILRARAIYYPVAYHFVRELGRGRQSTVFLGLRQGSRGCITEQAIKVMDPRLYRSPEEYWTDMGRIAYQIAKLQRLRSPNIVASHSYDETYGIGYVQMDAVDGMDIRLFLSRRNLEAVRSRGTAREWSKFTSNIFSVRESVMRVQPGVVVYVMMGILRALESLHDLGFLHCDIKPGNIMIDRLGYVKVVDLGRAVVAGERQSFLLGSPMYMAPEIHRREPALAQSDLYSVGLVGLEMLRGVRLTDRNDVTEEELLRIKMELPDRLPSLLPRNVSVNRDLVAILRKFIDHDPARRFQTAAEAQVGNDGLLTIDKQLIRAGLDSEYERELADYFEKFVDERTDRVECPYKEGGEIAEASPLGKS